MDQEKPGTSINHGKRTRPLLLQPSPKIARVSAYASSTSSSVLKNSKKLSPNSPRKPKVLYNKSDVPAPGTPVPDKHVRKAGPYLLGPKLGPSPVKSIVQCLARKEKTDEFYQIKILTLRNEGQTETQDDRQGKMLLHTEYSLLSLLKDQDGVIHHHGLFKVSGNICLIITSVCSLSNVYLTSSYLNKDFLNQTVELIYLLMLLYVYIHVIY